MAQLSFSFLLLLLSTSCIAGTANPTDRPGSQSLDFVEAECRATLYPQLCVHCLSYYANTTGQSQQQLAQIALTVSLARAQYTRAYVTKVARQLEKMNSKEWQPVKDCLAQISDAVAQVSQSINELRRINQDGVGNFMWHMRNVQSWLSAALTDATTCIDGFSGHAMGGKVKATIKARVLNVAQTTSNALALFNRFAAKHRASGATTKP